MNGYGNAGYYDDWNVGYGRSNRWNNAYGIGYGGRGHGLDLIPGDEDSGLAYRMQPRSRSIGYGYGMPYRSRYGNRRGNVWMKAGAQDVDSKEKIVNSSANA